MPRNSVTFSNTAYTASFRITIRAPPRSIFRLLRRSKPDPRSFHWFCSLSMNNFPRTLWIVSSSSSPVSTSCSLHFPPVTCSPQTLVPPSASSSSPEPEPALNRSPNVFSVTTSPSREPLSLPSPGALLSLSPRARFAAGAPLAPNRP